MQYQVLYNWRRERDSNPRYGFPHTHFPGVRLQPLGHPSAVRIRASGWTPKETVRSRIPGEKRRVGTIRMIMAALKDKEIESEGRGKPCATLLQKMTKSRKESQEIYEKAGRVDLATQESEEIAIIQGFLPQQLTEAEVAQAIASAVAETGATSIKDMGKVVGALKGNYAGRMDFTKAGELAKSM